VLRRFQEKKTHHLLSTWRKGIRLLLARERFLFSGGCPWDAAKRKLTGSAAASRQHSPGGSWVTSPGAPQRKRRAAHGVETQPEAGSVRARTDSLCPSDPALAAQP